MAKKSFSPTVHVQSHCRQTKNNEEKKKPFLFTLLSLLSMVEVELWVHQLRIDAYRLDTHGCNGVIVPNLSRCGSGLKKPSTSNSH